MAGGKGDRRLLRRFVERKIERMRVTRSRDRTEEVLPPPYGEADRAEQQ